MGLGTLIIMVCMACITICYYFFMWYNFCLIQAKDNGFLKTSSIYPGVSVIISSKNAGRSIHTLVQKILKQHYPVFELIVIDDISTDASFDALKNINCPNLILLKSSDDQPGKKLALQEGISKAKYPILLFTDADCSPQSDNWIKKMVDHMPKLSDREIVLGYGPLYLHKNLLSRFARYETFMTALQYFSYAGAKIPYMGVGRNLLFTKTLFYEVGGYTSHQDIASGDDDLFIQMAATYSNIGLCLDPETYMFSEGKQTIRDFLVQKKRHISTSIYYKSVHQLLLGLFSMSHLVFYTMIILILMFYPDMGLMVVGIWLIKIGFQMIFCRRAMTQLDVRDLFIWLPLLDVILYFYYGIMSVYGLTSKTKW